MSRSAPSLGRMLATAPRSPLLASSAAAVDGPVVGWGNDALGEMPPPPTVDGTNGTATAIAASGFHTCAIRADRAAVVSWGYAGSGQATPPNELLIGSVSPGRPGRFERSGPFGGWPTCSAIAIPRSPCASTPMRCGTRRPTFPSRRSVARHRMGPLKRRRTSLCVSTVWSRDSATSVSARIHWWAAPDSNREPTG